MVTLMMVIVAMSLKMVIQNDGDKGHDGRR